MTYPILVKLYLFLKVQAGEQTKVSKNILSGYLFVFVEYLRNQNENKKFQKLYF